MSRKYKFLNPSGLYFVSFATVYWLDIFTREEYFHHMVKSLQHCQQTKGMEIYCWCIMTNHVHLIFRTSGSDSDPGELMRSLKTYTANQIPKLIEENPQESRREWLLWMMERAAQAKSNVKHRQFWRQDNKPIELWSEKVIAQKMNYIHNNPVLNGFVTEPWHWKYSSAIDYAGGKGLLPLSTL